MKLQTYKTVYYKMFTSRQNARQNKRTNQIIINKRTKTKWSNKSLIIAAKL